MFLRCIEREQQHEMSELDMQKRIFFCGKVASNLTKPKMKFFHEAEFTLI